MVSLDAYGKLEQLEVNIELHRIERERDFAKHIERLNPI